jgi:flagellar FliL protein
MAQDPKKEEAAATEAAPPSKKKLIIIIAAVLLLAIIGGGAGWYFTHQKHPDKKEEKKHEPPKAPVFLPLETFTVNLLPDPDEKFLQVDTTLQLASPEAAELMKVQMPAIRNRILMLLTSKKPSDISSPEGKAQLSEEMLAELKKPFVKGEKPQEVTGVLFTSFVVQ